MLALNNSLKKLNLNFARLKDIDIHKHANNHFPESGNISIETLKIKLTSGRMQSLAVPQWQSFLGMFANLHHLTIECADFSKDVAFLKNVLFKMPHLRTLYLRKCVLNGSLAGLSEVLANQACQIEDLVLDFDNKLNGPTMERQVIQMLDNNTSLKSLWMTRSVKLAIDITHPLLQAIGRHTGLSRVTIENAKLSCSTESHFERLKETIVGMA